jgi:hypothetical protein
LVVKFADTPKDKETKKIQQQQYPNHNILIPQINPGNSIVKIHLFSLFFYALKSSLA